MSDNSRLIHNLTSTSMCAEKRIFIEELKEMLTPEVKHFFETLLSRPDGICAETGIPDMVLLRTQLRKHVGSTVGGKPLSPLDVKRGTSAIIKELRWLLNQIKNFESEARPCF